MNKKTLIWIIVVLVLIVGAVWYMNAGDTTSNAGTTTSGSDTTEPAPALTSDNGVFNEIDTAVDGLE